MGNQGQWWVPQLTRKDGEVIKVWKPQKWEWPEVMAILKKFNEVIAQKQSKKPKIIVGFYQKVSL